MSREWITKGMEQRMKQMVTDKDNKADGNLKWEPHIAPWDQALSNPLKS